MDAAIIAWLKSLWLVDVASGGGTKIHQSRSQTGSELKRRGECIAAR
jgi:hypothetical protein